MRRIVTSFVLDARPATLIFWLRLTLQAATFSSVWAEKSVAERIDGQGVCSRFDGLSVGDYGPEKALQTSCNQESLPEFRASSELTEVLLPP